MRRVRGFAAVMTTFVVLVVLATPVAAAPSDGRSGSLFAGLFQEVWASLGDIAGSIWLGGPSLGTVEAPSVSPPDWGGSQGSEPPEDGATTESVTPPEWDSGSADEPPKSP